MRTEQELEPFTQEFVKELKQLMLNLSDKICEDDDLSPEYDKDLLCVLSCGAMTILLGALLLVPHYWRGFYLNSLKTSLLREVKEIDGSEQDEKKN